MEEGWRVETQAYFDLEDAAGVAKTALDDCVYELLGHVLTVEENFDVQDA